MQIRLDQSRSATSSLLHGRGGWAKPLPNFILVISVGLGDSLQLSILSYGRISITVSRARQSTGAGHSDLADCLSSMNDCMISVGFPTSVQYIFISAQSQRSSSFIFPFHPNSGHTFALTGHRPSACSDRHGSESNSRLSRPFSLLSAEALVFRRGDS